MTQRMQVLVLSLKKRNKCQQTFQSARHLVKSVLASHQIVQADEGQIRMGFSESVQDKKWHQAVWGKKPQLFIESTD